MKLIKLINRDEKTQWSVRVLMILITVIGILLIVLTCRDSSKSEVGSINYLIGVSQHNLVEPWRIALNRDIKDTSKKYKDMRVIYTDASQKDEEQILDIEELLRQGIDALIVCPSDSVNLNDILKQVNKEIPIILVGKQIITPYYQTYIGPDNEALGKEAGIAISELLGSAGGNIVEVKGTLDAISTEERSNSFRTVIRQHANIHIVDTVYADWMRDKAEDQIKKIIMQHKDIDVIYAHNDEMAYGAYIAADKFRIKGIKFFGAGGLEGPEGGQQLVKSHILQNSFEYNTGGVLAVTYAVDLINGEEVPRVNKMPIKKIESDSN